VFVPEEQEVDELYIKEERQLIKNSRRKSVMIKDQASSVTPSIARQQ